MKKDSLGWEFWFAVIGGITMTLTTYYVGMEKIRDEQAATREIVKDGFNAMNIRMTLIEARLPTNYTTRKEVIDDAKN